MADDPRLIKAFDLIKEVILSEYARGSQDAIRRLSQLAQAEFGGSPEDHDDHAEDDADDSPESGRKRAPRGMVRVLVLRALEAGRGATTHDIKESAQDGVERMVSMGSIRNELRRGAAEGRYHEEGGRWFMASGTKQHGRP